jgi:VWFA-related protein
MRDLHLGSSTLALALTAAGASAQQPQQPPTFGVEAQLVLVDVRVVRDGQPVPGLKPSDFAVFEDGVERPVAHFEEIWARGIPRPQAPGRYVVHPRAFVFVVDELHLTPFQAEEVKRAMIDFIHTGTQDGDLVAVVSVAGAKHGRTLVPDGREAMSAMLRGLRGRYAPDRTLENLSEAEAQRIVNGDRSTLEAVVQRIQNDRRWEVGGPRSPVVPEDDTEHAFRETGLTRQTRRLAHEVFGQAERSLRGTLGILLQALEWSSKWRGRKAFVLASDGFILEPSLPDFSEVARAAQRANASVYFLDARALEPPAQASGERSYADPISSLSSSGFDRFGSAAGTEVVALDSGGLVLTNQNNLGVSLDRVARDSSAYYLLGYEPPVHPKKKKRNELRRIEVKVDLDGVEVRHRKGY